MNHRTIARRISPILLLLGMVAPARGGNVAADRRKAYGDERATQLEAVTEKLIPGASVQWEPSLSVRTASGVATPLDVISFLTSRQKDGSSYAVLAFEVGKEKEEYLERLQKLKPVEKSVLPTTLAVARVDPSGRVVSLNRVALKTGDPVTKIASLDVMKWQPGGWPVLRLQYRSYLTGPDSLTTLEWDALFDTQSGAFLARIPAGIIVKKKSGEETGDFFAVRRTGEREIEILGAMTRKSVKYACGDPCVVESSAFLKEWADGSSSP